jgi:hypothetical protein
MQALKNILVAVTNLASAYTPLSSAEAYMKFLVREK